LLPDVRSPQRDEDAAADDVRRVAGGEGPHKNPQWRTENRLPVPHYGGRLLDVPETLAQRRTKGRIMPEGAPDRPLRILVADDDLDVRASLRMVLTLLGHEVTEAGDGASALEAARATKPHVALLDLAMPRGSGLEVARQIRRDPSLRGILLVAVSGYGQEEVVAQALAAGFDRHFLKPLELADLQALLAERASRPGE
jgi:CheY-like chemotaxis protein